MTRPKQPRGCVSRITGKSCEHRVTTGETYDTVRKVLVPIRICHECSTWLSLGPSDETDERVACEIRAAELASYGGARRRPDGAPSPVMSYGEVVGSDKWPHRTPVTHDEWRGWLSVQIVNHEADLAGANWAGQHNADYDIANTEDA